MENINFLVVFLEGILSFISPCILPILPVYLTILANSGIQSLETGDDNLKRGTLIRNTILFILGISTTFFILGASMSILNKFLFQNKQVILSIGGVLIILMGLFYMGYLQLPFLQKEKKFHMQVREMKPWTAYVLGFTFSFGWTPCIGPMLASVLIMAGASKNVLTGNLLIATYSIGFMIPFILIAMFYKRLFRLLDKVKIHMGIIQKIGGIILIVSGTIMLLGGAQNVGGNLTGGFEGSNANTSQNEGVAGEEQAIPEEAASEEDSDKILAPDFTLQDQYGNTHTLSDYQGKTVFLNFWATWCPPCKEEMPYIEQIYEEYGLNEDEVVVLGVAMPNLGREGSKEHITEFLEEEGYTFPVVFDETGALAYQYYINAFPTTVIIDVEGNVHQYVSGAMNKETMKYLIEDAR